MFAFFYWKFLPNKNKIKNYFATLTESHEGEINANEVLEYFQKCFRKTRGSRESLIKLADNKPGWEFSGSTDNIFKMAEDLFYFDTPVYNRSMMIGIQGGSGERLFFISFWNIAFFWLIFEKKGVERAFFWTISQGPSTMELYFLWQQKIQVIEKRKKSIWESSMKSGKTEYLLSTFP